MCRQAVSCNDRSDIEAKWRLINAVSGNVADGVVPEHHLHSPRGVDIRRGLSSAVLADAYFAAAEITSMLR